jgi:osmotically-inducible protein OsmY
MTLRPTIFILFLLLPLLALTGCDNTTANQTKTIQMEDTSLNVAVSDALKREAFFNNSTITVTSEQGEISLNGTVNSTEDKSRAGAVAEKVTGVKAVKNNLNVITPSISN